MDKYDHIINMSHHKSSRHMPMSRESRAAQFAPFAALVGYESVINETARLTESKRLLSDDQIGMINLKLQIIQSRTEDKVTAEVTYFKSDCHKSGGSYITVNGCIE